MTVKEAYKVMQEHCGIEVGDTVRVLRKALDFEMGWEEEWSAKMDATIGKEFRVSYVRKSGGFCLNNEWWYPFFVLELVSKKSALPSHIQKAIDEGDFGCRKSSVEKLVVEILKGEGK